MLGPQIMDHRWSQFLLLGLIITVSLSGCGPAATPTAGVALKPPVPTDTPEPTFTPSSPPTAIPQPSPNPTAAKPTPTTTPAEPTPTPARESLLSGLSGRILDENTNQPVAGAKIRVGSATATTDADGHYTLTDLPPGQYALSITHPDYDPGLSSIFNLAAGQELSLDLTLYAPDTSPYPKDPMLTNPLDPEGAPTAEDAERLARLQGMTGEVVDIRDISLSGEYLVNYQIGDEVRAAVADLNHDVWELKDDAGQTWWVLKVCGNLASSLPTGEPIPTPRPIALPLVAEVIVDDLIVRECASEACAEVGAVQLGTQVEVIGCLAYGGWCQVSIPSGGSGWCTGRSLRQLAVAPAVPVVQAELPTTTPEVSTVGDLIAILPHDKVRDLVFSPDGRYLFTVGGGSILQWDVSTGGVRAEFGNGWGNYLGISADGSYLAAIIHTTVSVWNTSSGTKIHEIEIQGLPGEQSCYSPEIFFAPASNHFATNSNCLGRNPQGLVQVWSAQTGEEVARFSHSTDDILDVAFSPDESRVATAGRDNAKIWDLSSGKWLISLDHGGQVWDVDFSPDGKRIATISDDIGSAKSVARGGNTAKLWDASSGEELAVFPLTGWGQAITFSPDGMQLATGGYDNAVNLWDASSAAKLYSISREDNVDEVVFSPDGSQLAVRGFDKVVNLIDASTGEMLATLDHGDIVRAIAFSPDGTLLASASDDGYVRLWSTSEEEGARWQSK